MIVNKLDVVSVPLAPDEADAPLLVDANRMLSAPVARKRLEPVSRRYAQVVKPRNRVEQKQLSNRALGDIPRYAFRRLPAAKSAVGLSLNDRIIAKRTKK
jgi:hypothetical protein